MGPTGFETAIEKAKVKRFISEQLASLSLDARRDVLADLLLALDEPVVAKNHARSQPSQSNGTTHAVNGAHAARSRPSRGPAMAPSAETKTEAIFEALKARPGMPIAEVAKLVYPGQEDCTHRVRAILWQLKKKGRAHNPAPGQWEVTK